MIGSCPVALNSYNSRPMGIYSKQKKEKKPFIKLDLTV